MNKPRFIANIVIIVILLSVIVVNAEDDDDADDWNWDSGDIIIWPEDDPYHGEWNDEIILGPSAGSDVPFTYNDHDFEVNEYATSGTILCDDFQKVMGEDVDITLFGANLDDDGNRRIVATSASSDPQEEIYLLGTPDPERLDDFDRGGIGTWTLRAYNYVSGTFVVTYDLTIDIYYEGAEYYLPEESQDS